MDEKENIEEEKKEVETPEAEVKKETETEANNEEKETPEENYVPEQLDDDDFEKEKAKIKAEKAAKKAEKKAKKAKKEVELDENGNPIKRKMKKSEIITIAVIIVIVLAIIIGIAGYLIYSLNKPENVVKDFVSYINEEEWESAINLVDMQGYLTMALIDIESEEDDSNTSYMDFESKYDSALDELGELGYEEISEALEYGQENYEEILESVFSSTTITVDSVDSIERIGDTKLYKIAVTFTMSDDTGTYSDETVSYDMYVAKIDGEYKIVGGTFAEIIFYYYEYYYAYSIYYAE